MIECYLRSVRGWLPGSWRLKNRLLSELRPDLEAFLEAHPEADVQELERRFGSPQLIAACCVRDTGMETAVKDFHLCHRLTGLAAACMAMIAVLLAGFLLWALYIGSIFSEDTSLPAGYQARQAEQSYFHPAVPEESAILEACEAARAASHGMR